MPLFQSRRLVPALILAAGLGAGLAASLAAGPARALPPLAENDRVLREFFAVAVGKAIVDNCPSIDARMMYLGIRTVELQNYVTQARNGFYFIYGSAAPDDAAAQAQVAQIIGGAAVDEACFGRLTCVQQPEPAFAEGG